jgi:hypothetical protein
MKTTQATDQEKTDFHYFCSLLHDDIGIRMAQDAVSDKCFELCNNLRQTIAEAQEFYGHDAPVDDEALMYDIDTFDPITQTKPEQKVIYLPQRIINLLRETFQQAFILILFLFFASSICMAQNDALGYVARVATIHGDATELKILEPPLEPMSFKNGLTLLKPGDTIRVGLRLSCKDPQYIWSCYRIRVKLSDSATAFKYLDPNKNPLPKGCQILEIIWPFRKTVDLPER